MRPRSVLVSAPTTNPERTPPREGQLARGAERGRAALVVLAVLVGLVVVLDLLDLVGPGRGHPNNEMAALTQMANLSQAIENYRLDNRKLPAALEKLLITTSANTYPYIDRIPPDPWGREFVYRPLPDATYSIRSLGADGKPGTADDLSWPEDRP